MDIQSLIQACADGVASGGFEILGGALAAATINLIRRLRNHSMPNETQAKLLSMSELANSKQLAADLKQAAGKDPEIRNLLKTWEALAEDYAKGRYSSSAVVSNSNYVGNIRTTSGVTITQTIYGAEHDAQSSR